MDRKFDEVKFSKGSLSADNDGAAESKDYKSINPDDLQNDEVLYVKYSIKPSYMATHRYSTTENGVKVFRSTYYETYKNLNGEYERIRTKYT